MVFLTVRQNSLYKVLQREHRGDFEQYFDEMLSDMKVIFNE